jgi:pimeloyl-ACP methyl ester carboxylesterase
MHGRPPQADVAIDATARWESGAGGGPTLRGRRADPRPGAATLHFLPGNGFCGGVYWPFLKQFLTGRATPAGGYGLFLHDIEGHGDSDAPAHFSGIGAVARRVPLVAQEQGLRDGRPLVGMGHSFGAALTLKVAADNPGLFQALVLLDPIVFPPPMWFVSRAMAALNVHPMAKAARKRRREWASREDVIERLRGRGIYKGWTEEALQCFAEHATHDEAGQRVLSCPPGLEAEIYERPVYPWPSFRNVQVPILFLYGKGSYPIFEPASRLARRANPRVEVASVPGHHCFMLEDPADAHQAVAAFLSKNNL